MSLLAHRKVTNFEAAVHERNRSRSRHGGGRRLQGIWRMRGQLENVRRSGTPTVAMKRRDNGSHSFARRGKWRYIFTEMQHGANVKLEQLVRETRATDRYPSAERKSGTEFRQHLHEVRAGGLLLAQQRRALRMEKTTSQLMWSRWREKSWRRCGHQL